MAVSQDIPERKGKPERLMRCLPLDIMQYLWDEFFSWHLCHDFRYKPCNDFRYKSCHGFRYNRERFSINIKYLGGYFTQRF